MKDRYSIVHNDQRYSISVGIKPSDDPFLGRGYKGCADTQYKLYSFYIDSQLGFYNCYFKDMETLRANIIDIVFNEIIEIKG
jgi:hypothetical protein